MDTFKLKVIAVSAMLIDYIGVILIGTKNDWLYLACRIIGSIAYPIFAFLIIQGFQHTSNIKKYIQRLFAFAIISEIPYDLAMYQYHYGKDVFTELGHASKDIAYSNTVLNSFSAYQNVIFTLFLGLSLITIYDLIEKKFNKNTVVDLLIGNSLDGGITVIFCALAFLLHTDYGIAGILIIAAFYLFKDNKALMLISLILISGTMQCSLYNYTQSGNLMSVIRILSVLAFIPIFLFNGKKGKHTKYFFYVFYPAQLLCLFIIGLFF